MLEAAAGGAGLLLRSLIPGFPTTGRFSPQGNRNLTKCLGLPPTKFLGRYPSARYPEERGLLHDQEDQLDALIQESPAPCQQADRQSGLPLQN